MGRGWLGSSSTFCRCSLPGFHFLSFIRADSFSEKMTMYIHQARLPRGRERAGRSWESPWRQRRGGAPGTPGPRRGREARLAAPAPAAVPPPSLPPLPGPRRPSAPPEGGSAINKRRSVARGPRSCCASRQIAGSGRPASRHREPPGRAGERSRAGPQPPPLPSRSMAPQPPPPVPPSCSEGPRGSGYEHSVKD